MTINAEFWVAVAFLIFVAIAFIGIALVRRD